MLWRILVLGLLGVWAEGATAEAPSEFYIVMDGNYQQRGHHGDASYWELLSVLADGRDSVVRYVRLEQVFEDACGRGLIAKAIEARLLDVSPAELTREANPCGADQRALRAANTRRDQGASIFEPQEMGIVAQCGAKQIKLRLIDPRIVKSDPPDRFSVGHSELWGLASRVIDRAFPNRIPWDAGSEQGDRKTQAVGARLVPELSTGRYDKGLRQACNPQFKGCPSRTFSEILADYQGSLDTAKLAVVTKPLLIDADRYEFVKYANPLYPALARSARIQGTVELLLAVDASTGDVINVAPVSGNPMLFASATAAAKQWRFTPGFSKSESIKVALEYAIRCPTNPSLIPTVVQ